MAGSGGDEEAAVPVLPPAEGEDLSEAAVLWLRQKSQLQRKLPRPPSSLILHHGPVGTPYALNNPNPVSPRSRSLDGLSALSTLNPKP